MPSCTETPQLAIVTVKGLGQIGQKWCSLLGCEEKSKSIKLLKFQLIALDSRAARKTNNLSARLSPAHLCLCSVLVINGTQPATGRRGASAGCPIKVTYGVVGGGAP